MQSFSKKTLLRFFTMMFLTAILNGRLLAQTTTPPRDAPNVGNTPGTTPPSAPAPPTFILNNDSLFKAGTPNSGRIWGYAFGDFYWKSHADSLGRGGSNQYTGVPKDKTAFAFRRIYLGYDYNINKKFSVELLLAAEDNFYQISPSGTVTTSGDLLTNNKLAFYIKLANIRWHNIWKGTDLVVGQGVTPAFPLMSERIWGYRSIERTITDIRRTGSFDLGASLQGTFDKKQNFGYNVMVGNGSGDKPDPTTFKWFYGDVWGMFFEKKLVLDFYADYNRLNQTPTWHHSRNMYKAFAAYTTPALTIGVEGYINNLKNDNALTPVGATNPTDTVSAKAKGISMFITGNIVPGRLRFFARYDLFRPTDAFDNTVYKNDVGLTSNYNAATTNENFATAGLDIMANKNVHLMPNVWYNDYHSTVAGATGVLKHDYDLVYRLTFFFTFGRG